MNAGPNEYRVTWRRGEPYAQTDEEYRQGRVDLEKWLTYLHRPAAPVHASLGYRRSARRMTGE